jgi:predicted 3-demethylubiquinone-9 3-methyltransferase (glyoxalase superfamily)
MHKISPFLWFDDDAEDAANLYVSIFGGKIIDEHRWGPGGPAPEGSLMSVIFEIDGREYQAFNGGPGHPFSDAASLAVSVETQEELDDAWDRLIEGGGQPVACGWLTDRFGLSWQIVPAVLGELLSDPDSGRSSRALEAMLSMVKLDIAALRAAADG